MGTPPPARGKQAGSHDYSLLSGHTPACAGETLSVKSLIQLSNIQNAVAQALRQFYSGEHPSMRWEKNAKLLFHGTRQD